MYRDLIRVTVNRSSPNTGSNTVRVVMALGLTGQFSWQTMQGVPMAQGRQRPLSTNAVPIRIGPASTKLPRPIRSSNARGRMAAVGQT